MDIQIKGESTDPGILTARNIFDNITIEHAKCVAVFLVILITVIHVCNYHSIKLEVEDPSCDSLLTDGQYVTENNYQPKGCSMHYYSTEDARQCLLNRYKKLQKRSIIHYYGASKVRNLFAAFANFIEGSIIFRGKPHKNLKYSNPKLHLTVVFYWSTLKVNRRLKIFDKLLDSAQNKPEDFPDLILNGGGKHVACRFEGLNATLEEYKDSNPIADRVESFVPYFKNMSSSSTRLIWLIHEDVEKLKLIYRISCFTTETFRKFNEITEKTFKDTDIKLWKSVRAVWHGSEEDKTVDGIHLKPKVLGIDNQIFINYYCNEFMQLNNSYCCTKRILINNQKQQFITEQLTISQITLAFIAILSLVATGCSFLWRYLCHCPTKHNDVKSHDLSKASVENNDQVLVLQVDNNKNQLTLSDVKAEAQNAGLAEFFSCVARLGLIMAYFYLCDRTLLFKKEEKHYSHLYFFLPLVILLIIGVVCSTKSKYTWILHRDETDEWKGWMQIVILIYHYTAASQIIPIYMHIRVLVSSYLFLSGFGHFSYYYNKADFSLHRLCTVLFRFNLLVIMLCVTMNRTYQFYYFVPLVSFWFIICHLLMSLWPRVTKQSSKANTCQYLYLILKLVVLVVFISAFYAYENLFDYIFMTEPMRSLFTTSDGSLHEWRFRWSIDRYSTVYGMVLALLLIYVDSQFGRENPKSENMFSIKKTIFTFVLSISGIMAYGVFSRHCADKPKCNQVHALISFMPILSFVMLRNVFGWLRTRYSYFFAWFGRISLELFISQYHIWLASDTHKLLVLFPSNAFLNLCITSFIFVCVAHEIHSITSKLVTYIIPKDLKLLLRNLIILSVFFSTVIYTACLNESGLGHVTLAKIIV